MSSRHGGENNDRDVASVALYRSDPSLVKGWERRWIEVGKYVHSAVFAPVAPRDLRHREFQKNP